MIIDVLLSVEQATWLKRVLEGQISLFMYETSFSHNDDVLEAVDAALHYHGVNTACEVCGDPVPVEPGTSGRPRRTCSDSCRQKAYRQRVSDRKSSMRLRANRG